MTSSRKRWTRGHSGWAAGTVLMFAAGIIFGLIWGNVWLGIVLAAAVSMGWLLAYESWRGRNVGLENRDDDGAQL
ncbi:hypothetical protein [Microbacterium pumilum]|uniref:Uncharacterized protein n=1 Tax=Microbacterium pumilum TaxID=344165 RepID=A0ABP5EKF1_9MICO